MRGTRALVALIAAIAALAIGAPAPHADVPAAQAAGKYPSITDATSFRTLWSRVERDRRIVVRALSRDYRAARSARPGTAARRLALRRMARDIRAYRARQRLLRARLAKAKVPAALAPCIVDGKRHNVGMRRRYVRLVQLYRATRAGNRRAMATLFRKQNAQAARNIVLSRKVLRCIKSRSAPAPTPAPTPQTAKKCTVPLTVIAGKAGVTATANIELQTDPSDGAVRPFLRIPELKGADDPAATGPPKITHARLEEPRGTQFLGQGHPFGLDYQVDVDARRTEAAATPHIIEGMFLNVTETVLGERNPFFLWFEVVAWGRNKEGNLVGIGTQIGGTCDLK